jgi:hypothetical protein
MLGTRTSRPHPRSVIPDIKDRRLFRASRSCGRDVRVPGIRLSGSIAGRSQSDHSLDKRPNPENLKNCELSRSMTLMFDDSYVGSRPDSFLISRYQVLNLALPHAVLITSIFGGSP